MRFELAGTIAPPTGPPGPGNPSNPPEGVLVINADTTMNLKDYADQGFTAVEVICVGAGGGRGGGYYAPSSASGPLTDTQNLSNPDTIVYWGWLFYGGAGGGGGVHKVAFDLLGLPDSVDIKVGKGGRVGTWQRDLSRLADPKGNDREDLWLTTNGEDGGPSSFNGMDCCASGGMGGNRVEEVIWYDPNAPPPWQNVQSTNNTSGLHNAPNSNGGDGGIGASVTAGGGGAGGKHIKYDVHAETLISAASDPEEGLWTPETGVGRGGGGGYGSDGTLYPKWNFATQQQTGDIYRIIVGASFGADGNYSDADFSFMTHQSPPFDDPVWPHLSTPEKSCPGPGGGATTPYTADSIYGSGNGLPLDYPGLDGVVILRFTAK